MSGFVGAWRLARALMHLLHGMAVIGLRFGSLDACGRQVRIQWWSGKLLRCMGIGLTVHGTPRPGATLLVANHISWLDIAAIHAAAPQARFVSKSDVKHWPLIDRLVAGAGTLFIERESKRDALRVVHRVADALHAGDMVAVFPEGTTGYGDDVLPFHANLIQAAIAAEAPVQPLALRFCTADGRPSIAPSYVGEDSLAQSVWRTVAAAPLVAHVLVGQARPAEGRDRRTWAHDLRTEVQALRVTTGAI